MRIVTGTSGFAYAHWKGPFYPADLGTDAMLGHYAARLPAVEINNTFYRMPRREMLAGWAAATPPGFRFVLKASQRITHHARLVDAGDSVRYLAGQAEALGPKLGGLLFQLPPYLRADGADEARLRSFLAVLPPGIPAAIEFRHESWYTDATFALLCAHGVALVAVDWAEDEDVKKAAPLLATARHAYLRLRKSRYGDDELAGWVERLLRLGCEEAQIFFKDDDAGEAPDAAARLLGLAARVGAEVPGPLVPFEPPTARATTSAPSAAEGVAAGPSVARARRPARLRKAVPREAGAAAAPATERAAGAAGEADPPARPRRKR